MKRWINRRHLAVALFLAALLALTGCGSGLPAASWFGIAVNDETVYLAASEQVFAVSLESGAELWSFPAEPDKDIGPFYATPLLSDDSLVAGGYGDDGTIFVISRDSGTQEWAVETEATIVGGAVSVDGDLVVGNNEGEVILIDGETRAKRVLMEADAAIWARPLVDGTSGRIFVAAMDHHLYAIDLAQDAPIWAFEAGGALAGTPAVADGVVYIGALNDTFYAIDAANGTELWSFETEGWVWGGPLVAADTIYFGDMDGNVYALDRSNGTERWTLDTEDGVRVTPVLVEDTLYFGVRGGRVFAVDAEDGTQKWALTLEGSIYSQPIAVDDYLLISPHNAKVKLVALDLESGAERWSFPPREE